MASLWYRWCFVVLTKCSREVVDVLVCLTTSEATVLLYSWANVQQSMCRPAIEFDLPLHWETLLNGKNLLISVSPSLTTVREIGSVYLSLSLVNHGNGPSLCSCCYQLGA
jgi:hypothetical protein